MRWADSRWILYMILIAVFAAGFGIALMLYLKLNTPQMRGEIIKLLFQVSTVTVFGAVISQLGFEYQRRQQARDKNSEHERNQVEYKQTLLRDLLSDTTRQYARVKQLRRVARAHGIVERGQERALSVSAYDACMLKISSAQLKLENVIRDTETSGVIPEETSTSKVDTGAGEKKPSIKRDLGRMEAYLNNLVTEFEQERPKFSGDSVQLSSLPRFQDFLGRASESKIKAEFYDRFKDVQRAFRENLKDLSI